MNRLFTIAEVRAIILALKVGKCCGLDGISAEFLKAGIDILAPILTTLLNIFLVRRDFPAAWCEGLRLAIHKSGDRLDPTSYRGITILPTFEKVFEIGFNKRLEFLNEALCQSDLSNGGFLKGSRTSDNIFILQSIVTRQAQLGKKLYIIFVDFSKAFDLVNRSLLFLKLIKAGWGGRLLDTARSLYRKTRFRVRTDGKLSDSIESLLGVNQGGSASGILFRKFLADLSEYIDRNFGIRFGDELIAHLLWADDLLLLAETERNAQKLLDGLGNFCATNLMIANEIKTKCMTYGVSEAPNLVFNGIPIERVDRYKYVGNFVSPVLSPIGDIFPQNSEYLIKQARRALFAMRSRLENASPTPPSISLRLFQSLVKHIVCYNSDIWGV